jgi:von Willebrand factor A domain-containing protein 8
LFLFYTTGEKGCGKSVLVDYFAEKLNYGTPELICCYKDMTSRDLLQRRRTDEAGNTRWHTSPLAAAALEGQLAVLDGVNRLTSDALSVISSLVKDR